MSKIDNAFRYAYLCGGLVLVGVGVVGSIITFKKELNRYKGIDENNKLYNEFLESELKITKERLKQYTDVYGTDLGKAD